MTQNEKFAKWMKRQVRLAGEELIRRADQTSFEGWDVVSKIDITIDIPTYGPNPEMPVIKFSVEAFNKCAIDDILGGRNDYLSADSRIDDDHRIGDIFSDVDDKTKN